MTGDTGFKRITAFAVCDFQYVYHVFPKEHPKPFTLFFLFDSCPALEGKSHGSLAVPWV